MRRWLQDSAFAPWAGLWIGVLAWAAHHQLGSTLNYLDCERGGPPYVVTLGIACALFAACGGWISWNAAPAKAADGPPPTRLFAARVGAGAAGVFLLAIVMQTAAGAILPGCLR